MESRLPDIFTDIDHSILSDGSLDPMGLRIIWTSLGSRIFSNKLNTVSTDIRLYTINLFHHYVIYKCEKLFEEQYSKIIGTSVYNSQQDIRDGLLIFLECLLAHTLYEAKTQVGEQAGTVLGMTKLTGLKNNKPNDRRVIWLDASKQSGILTRQVLLGIHGRHKGPFQEMGLFKSNDYYSQADIWQEVGVLFENEKAWKNLYAHLCGILERLLKLKVRSRDPLSMKVQAVPINNELVNAYYQCLKKEMFSNDPLIQFWEQRLGLHSGAAGNLYTALKALEDSRKDYFTWQEVIAYALHYWSGPEREKVEAICAIEPLLTFVDKLSRRLLLRNTTALDADIYQFVQRFFESNTIDPNAIKTYLSNGFLDEEALKRLNKLCVIYQSCIETKDYIGFAQRMIGYHKEIMDQRGNIAWVTVNAANQVTLHRSFHYSEEAKKELQTTTWVNNYYLSTLYSLFKGLYYTAYATI